MMALKLPAGLRFFCLIAAFLLATAYGAEPRSQLIGLTQDQLIERYGEPKSQVAVGGRVLMFFERERVVLRNGVVVEVEPLPGESSPRPAPPPAEPAATTAPPAAGPATTPVPPEPVLLPKNDVPGTSKAPTSQPASTITPPVLTPPPEPQLSIKLVRPPSGNPPRKQDAPVAPASPDLVAPKPPPDGGAEPSPGGGGASSKSTPAASDAAPSSSLPSLDKAKKPTAGQEEKKAKPKAVVPRRRLDDANFPEPAENIFTLQTYVIALLVIGTGVGFLLWQRKQRLLELDATTVARTPFSASPASSGGAMFPANLLADLEWKRLEELVEAYYSKTGVVAARTKTGPQSPVHIRISWKGEPRPFACVQCIAHPRGLIDTKPIQDLLAVLAAEDIRRGYVVTTGKFNAAARNFAEEKHITLMPGDIFVEKLNALPASARAELVQEFSVGDYSTPSCPKCEAKMARATDNSAIWRCKAHPEITIPAWN